MAGPTVSRRKAIATGAAALAGVGSGALAEGQAPGVLTGTQAGRQYRAWVHSVPDPNRGALETLTMLPIGGRQVVVRTEATQCCYSNVGRVLGVEGTRGGFGGARDDQSIIFGHGGVGVVEAIGPDVRGIAVGDRVIVGVTPECGQCHNCLRGRADMCLVLFGEPNDPILAVATRADGTEVVQDTNIGGHAELIVTLEEWCVPVFTDAPAVELAMLHCVGGTGLGTTMTHAPVEPGADVVVFGCGPLGLSAVQGARIMGAGQIIAVEPVAYRRDVALAVGATLALDPAAEGDGLVNTLRNLCRGAADRKFAGAKPVRGGQLGPDFIIEAVGGTRLPVPPQVEAPPDPTGILPLEQAFDLCPAGGHLMTTGVAQQGNVSFVGGRWANGGRTHHQSQFGGTHLKRDIPRYVRLLENGQYDAASLATSTFTVEQTGEAHQAVADRTTVAAIITF
jgi:S-(hydroxymethyl)glutathione dehydrogenase/alcohol dehydrogenase